MTKLSVTGILRDYRVFDKEFWLYYKTLEKIHPEFDNIKMNILKSKRVNEKYILEVGKELYETEKVLLDKEWTEHNEEAKQIGTNTHEIIHNMFCTDLKGIKDNFGIDTDKYQLQKIENFLNTDNGIFPEFKLEIQLDEEFTLIGIPDLIIKEGNNISIIDWKTDEQIKFRSIFEIGKKRTKRFKYPLCNLEDCPGVQYQLQLSLYAKMIQMLNPNLKIKNLTIIQVKDLKKKKEFPIEYLEKDVENLLKWHIKNTKLQQELDKCKLIEY